MAPNFRGSGAFKRTEEGISVGGYLYTKRRRQGGSRRPPPAKGKYCILGTVILTWERGGNTERGNHFALGVNLHPDHFFPS